MEPLQNKRQPASGRIRTRPRSITLCHQDLRYFIQSISALSAPPLIFQINLVKNNLQNTLINWLGNNYIILSLIAG